MRMFLAATLSVAPLFAKDIEPARRLTAVVFGGKFGKGYISCRNNSITQHAGSPTSGRK